MSKWKIGGLVSFVIILIIVLNKPSMPQNALQQNIPIDIYTGKWYINMSTFPMWLKGNKTSPSFNYTIEMKDNIKVLHGDVQYLKKGKLKHIQGMDKPTNKFNTAFVWHGKGLLRLFKSKWEIIAYNPEQQWAIMHFQKTIATPEGYDLFSKQKQLDTQTLTDVNKKLEELGIKDQLKIIKQE